MRSLAILLSFVVAASAYVVTFPSSAQGWSISGPQQCTWQMGGGDPLNFTLVLVNPNNGYSQVLNALVDGSLGKLFVNPPGQGWPMGPGYRVQFAANSENITDVLAQSDAFSIMEPTVSSTTSSLNGTSTGTASVHTTATTSEISDTLYTPTFTNSFTPSTAPVSASPTETTSSGRRLFELPKTGLAILLAAVAAMQL